MKFIELTKGHKAIVDDDDYSAAIKYHGEFAVLNFKREKKDLKTENTGGHKRISWKTK